MENKIINYDIYFEELEKTCDLSDEKECETRLDLLRNIQDAVLEWETHIQEYDYKQFCKELAERGLRFTPVNDRTAKAKWTKLFAASVSKEKRKEVHFEQFRWHLFSFPILKALEDDVARAAFDTEPKDSVYLFWQHKNEASLMENAHLLMAEDIDHDFIPFYLIFQFFKTLTEFVHTEAQRHRGF